MALKKQVFNVPLSRGIDTKSSRLLAGADGKLSIVENASFNQEGSLIKRNGYDKLNKTNLEGGMTSASFGVHVFDNQILNSDGTYLRSYVEQEEHWKNIGRLPGISSRTDWIVNSPFEQTNPTSSVLNEMTFHAWEDSSDGYIHVKIRDLNGNTLVADKAIIQGIRPLLITFVGNVVLFCVVSNEIKMIRLTYYNVNNDAWLTDMTFSGLSTDKNFACCVVGDSLFLAYSTNTATQTQLSQISSYFGLLYNEPLNQSCARAVSIHSDQNESVYITSISSTNVARVSAIDSSETLTIFSSSLSLNVLSPHTSFVSGGVQSNIERAGTIAINTSSFSLFTQADKKVHHAIVNHLTGTASTLGSLLIANDSYLTSLPFVLDDRTCVCTTLSSSIQSTTFVMDELGFMMGKSVNQNSGFRSSGSLPYANTLDDGTITVDVERFERFETDEQKTDIRAPGSVGVSEMSLFKERVKSLKHLNSLHFPGSMMRSYDGSRLHETGFNSFPEVRSYEVQAGSGSVQAGTYTYAFTYQWIDNFSKLHESAGLKFTVDVPTNNSRVSFNVSSLGYTEKPGVALVGYRSNAPDEENAVLYQFTPREAPTKSVQYSSGTLVTDSNGVDVITTNRIFYGNGGELDNISPPSCKDAVTFANRFWTINSDDTSKLTFSKLVINATRDVKPTEFSDLLSLNVPDEDNEGIVALSTLDDKLIIFKSTKFYQVTGDGPNNAGNGTFSVPKLISNETGCSNPDSIVITRDGIMFKSLTGIQLLGRDMSITYIGKDVEEYNDLNIVSSLVVPEANQVRFLTDSSTALVYDYIQQQWNVWTNHESIGSVISSTGEYYRSLSNGDILNESTHYRDVDSFIKLRAETGWLPFAGINGFQLISRVMFLGERRGSHKLKISFAFNYVESFTDVRIIDTDDAIQGIPFGSGLYGSGLFGSNPKANQYGIHLGRKCNAIKIRIEDVQPFSDSDDFNEGFSMDMVSFLVGIKGGLFRTERDRNT